MEEKLQELRTKIDAIDGQIFNLLLDRVKIVEEVGHLKKSACQVTSIIRSGREAKMVANIFEKCKANGFDDKIAYGFANMWRSIICTSINIEQDCKIACHSERTYLMAREYFGIFLNPAKFEAPSAVINSLTNGSSNLGVVEAYIENRERPWWILLNESNDLKTKDFKVFATIPFIKSNYKNIFAIAKTEPEETGRDYSLYVLESIPDGAEVISEFEGKLLVKIAGYKPLEEINFIGSFAEVI
jgi:chorismate mutase/prephenate dehydratase